MKENYIKISSLKKYYESTRALDGISFSISEGEYVSLLGPNGAGKTTLFQILTGLFLPDDGLIDINGFNIRKNTVDALAQIGVVFQQITLDMDINVIDNLKFHADLHGIPKNEFHSRSEIELKQVNLWNKRLEKVRFLSGGQKRKIELARSLLHNPKLLLLDEPTVGLDPQSRRDLLEYIIEIKKRRNMIILWATHLVDEAEASDKVIILDKGKIKTIGTPNEIKKQTNKNNLHDAFIATIKEEKKNDKNI